MTRYNRKELESMTIEEVDKIASGLNISGGRQEIVREILKMQSILSTDKPVLNDKSVVVKEHVRDVKPGPEIKDKEIESYNRKKPTKK